MKKRHVAVITGTRADYGILLPVLKAIDNHPRLCLQLIVTGMHLLRRFGYTVREIEADGWRIEGRIKLQSDRDDVIGQSIGLGRAISRMTQEFARLKSEIVLVLGDRLEMFAAAAAATASQRVLAHIHGGDAAIGVQDDAYRHAISKLAHLHFAASNGAENRLKRLGEDFFRIYQTGSPALDDLAKKKCKNIVELNRWAGFDVNEDFVMVLQHPAGGSAAQEAKRMSQTLRGCDRKGLKMLVLYPNCDPGFSGIIKTARRFCQRKGWPLLRHVPRGIYLGLLEKTRALVGNSSSGIIEAGFLNVDVINVGHRQEGRDRGENVHDVAYGRDNVRRAIEVVMKGKRSARKPCHIYGRGKSGRLIASILAKVNLDNKLRQKKIAY